jgi:hypothetical protein
VFLYASDGFQKPTPFQPDIVVAIDSVMDQKLAGLAKIVSQFIEGGCGGHAGLVPRDEADLKVRQDQIRRGAHFQGRQKNIANRFRKKLIELYGEEAGNKVVYAEAFEVCEYGRRPGIEELRKRFLK